MCRIAGIIDKSRNREELATAVKSMCDVMAHGGPDGEGFFVKAENGLAFGHRRLAIIDLSSTGKQPMFYDNENLVIIYNGEIYNFQELKTELIHLGFDFKSHSDTEVILAAYAAWGTESFGKLKGMFAFALYDSEKKLSFLVRDPSGIKPLYYSNLNQSLIFASEVRAFRKLNPDYDENPDWKIYFLAFGHIPEPYTTLTDVKMLPKGNYLIWDHQTDGYIIKSLIREDFKNKSLNKGEAQVAIHNVLTKAVERHLLSDAPIGVFLSGGIDSSLISLVANKITSPKGKGLLNTLSINFEETAFSEKPYQDIVSSEIKGKHAEYTISKTIFKEQFPFALKAMDEPSTDGINSWFVNYFANQNGLKAVLSGIGADEIFGGYPSFKRIGLISKLSKLPAFILKKGINFKKTTLKRAYYLSYKNTAGKYLFLRGIFNPKEISELLSCSITKVDDVLSNIDIQDIPNHLEPGEQASWLECNIYMQNQLLKDTDSMSMQHGVEVRVPFLDQDLLVTMTQISNEIKFKGSKPKSLLVDSFIKLLPRQIWDRPKMGFTFPFQHWLKDDVMFLESITLANNKKAIEMVGNFKEGKLHWSKAMALHQIFKVEF